MNNPVIIVDAPKLTTEGAKEVYAFLSELLLAFEAHYYQKLISPNEPTELVKCEEDIDCKWEGLF